MNLVLVEWTDSSAYNGWHKFGAEDCVTQCVTIGILRHEDKEQIVLTPCISDFGNVSDTHAIPKGCIKRVRKLKVKSGRQN